MNIECYLVAFKSKWNCFINFFFLDNQRNTFFFSEYHFGDIEILLFHDIKTATSMLVTDVGDEMCWRQL